MTFIVFLSSSNFPFLSLLSFLLPFLLFYFHCILPTLQYFTSYPPSYLSPLPLPFSFLPSLHPSPLLYLFSPFISLYLSFSLLSTFYLFSSLLLPLFALPSSLQLTPSVSLSSSLSFLPFSFLSSFPISLPYSISLQPFRLSLSHPFLSLFISFLYCVPLSSLPLFSPSSSVPPLFPLPSFLSFPISALPLSFHFPPFLRSSFFLTSSSPLPLPNLLFSLSPPFISPYLLSFPLSPPSLPSLSSSPSPPTLDT